MSERERRRSKARGGGKRESVGRWEGRMKVGTRGAGGDLDVMARG